MLKIQRNVGWEINVFQILGTFYLNEVSPSNYLNKVFPSIWFIMQ